MNTVIRWIVLLPSAIVVAFLISFPLRIVLYTTLSNFIEPYPELPERLLFPFFASMVFIWIGSKVAPSRKLLVANLLMILWIVLSVITAIVSILEIEISGQQFVMHGGIFGPIFSIVGSIIGFIITKRQLE